MLLRKEGCLHEQASVKVKLVRKGVRLVFLVAGAGMRVQGSMSHCYMSK